MSFFLHIQSNVEVTKRRDICHRDSSIFYDEQWHESIIADASPNIIISPVQEIMWNVPKRKMAAKQLTLN